VIPSYGTGYLCSEHIPVATEGGCHHPGGDDDLQELAGEVTFLRTYVIDFDHDAIILSH
jgi:hypothetical protein